jgi:hypothetical protein
MSNDTTSAFGVTTPQSAPPPARPAAGADRAPRVATIVWGFLVLAVGIGVVSVAAGARLDVGLAAIWLLAAAGAVLVVVSVASTIRRRGQAQNRHP